MKNTFRLFPIALIVVGIALLLSKQGIVTLPSLHTWWPLILVAVGVNALLRPRASRRCAVADPAVR